jgi:hypothetical protein
LSASYDGTSWMQGVQLLEFRGDKVARERIYVMDAWEAPEWRAPWRADTPADPPEESFSQRSDHEPGLELGGEER